MLTEGKEGIVGTEVIGDWDAESGVLADAGALFESTSASGGKSGRGAVGGVLAGEGEREPLRRTFGGGAPIGGADFDEVEDIGLGTA